MKKQKPKHDPGQHPQYDSFKAHYRSTSAVLNPGRSPLNAEMWGMSDKKSLLGLQAQYEGKLANCLGLVEGVDEAFKEHKLQCRQQGRQEPTELPPELAETKAKFQAWADVLLEEVNHITELLGNFLDREKQEADAKILMFGPICCSWGRPIRTIDYQGVTTDKDGFPRIDCPKSPYHGMLVSDYRELVSKPWRKARTEAAAEALKKAEDTTLKISKEERDLLFTASQTGGRMVPWNELPPRPDGY